MIRNNYITKRRKILIITSSLKFGGGAERFISLLTKYLISKFTISVVTFQHFKNLYPFKGKYYTFKENLKYFRNFKIFELFRPFKIFKLINSLSPDLIISFMDFANVYSIITKCYSISNQPYSDIGIGHIEVDYRFQNSDDTMKGKVEAMWDANGKHTPLLLLNYDTNFTVVPPVYCSITNDITFAHKKFDKWDYSLDLREAD